MQRLPVCFWTMENQDIESPESPSPLQKPSTLEQMATKKVSSTKEASTEFLSPNVAGSRPASNGHSESIEAECLRSSASYQPQEHQVGSLNCPWMGCETSFETISDFANHGDTEHDFSRKSFLEMRVQVFI